VIVGGFSVPGILPKIQIDELCRRAEENWTPDDALPI
jgi:hypothetical protein